MRSQSTLALSLRLFKGEWRSSELRILILALLVAVTATSTISFFTDRLASALLNRSAEMLGGDLVVKSSRRFELGELLPQQQKPLVLAEVTEFSSVVLKGDQLLLTSVKAVSERYPLYGTLQLMEGRQGTLTEGQQGPRPGTVWVDTRVLDRLQVNVGDTVNIGAAEFKIDQLLVLEPDRSGSFISLAPRVMMNAADLPSAKVLQRGSRANYNYYFAGDKEALAPLEQALKPNLGVGASMLRAGESQQGAGLLLKRTQQYLALTALLAVILAAIAVAVAARRYSLRQYDVSATLRCLGASKKTLFRVYALQLLTISLVCGFVGTLLGWGVQFILSEVLRDAIQLVLPKPGWAPWLVGMIAGTLVLFGTALPSLWRLQQVPPLRVIRRDLTPLPMRGWLIFLVAWLALCCFILLLTRELLLVFVLLAGLAAVSLLMGLLIWLVFKLSKRLNLKQSGFVGRGLSRVSQRAKSHTLQITALAMTLMLMSVIGMLRFELLSSWSAQMPDTVPNHFAFNILPEDSARIGQYFDQRGLERPTLYPMVRGRLIEVNGIGVKDIRTTQDEEDRSDPALRRELNLSWVNDLPDNNRIEAGRWHSLDADAAVDGVSIETELAERLGINLEDQLTFDIGGQKLTATVTSLRSVEWESFTPNFYMLFAPSLLEDFPATYVTSFRLEGEHRQLLTQLVKAFPAMTVLEVDALISQLQKVLAQVTTLIELMLLFVLLAGLCVLLAVIQAGLSERLREGALMRAFGASRHYLRTVNYLEFSIMGLLAGLLAMSGAELAAALLYQHVFDLTTHWHWEFWLAVPLLSAILVALVGGAATRATVEQSPMSLLKQYD